MHEAWRRQHEREHEALEKRLADRADSAMVTTVDAIKKHIAGVFDVNRKDIEALQTETKAQTQTLVSQNTTMAEQGTKLDMLVSNAEENATERGRRVEREAIQEQERKLRLEKQAERDRKAERELKREQARAERELKQEQAKAPRYALYSATITAIVGVIIAFIAHGC